MDKRELTEFQQACSEEIVGRIVKGERRIILSLASGVGVNNVILNVIDRIGVYGQSILVVYGNREQADAYKPLLQASDRAHVEIIDFSTMVEKQPQPDILFLMGASEHPDEKVSEYLEKSNALIISFVSSHQAKSGCTYIAKDSEKGQEYILHFENSDKTINNNINRTKMISRINRYRYWLQLVEKQRCAMEAELNSSDERVREYAVSEFVRQASEEMNSSEKELLPGVDVERNTDELRELLSEDVWDKKLSEESKKCLTTAKSTFDMMGMLQQQNSVDYSGVCILITKAVDLEVSKRLYRKYVNYLERRFPKQTDLGRWPYSLLNDGRTAVIQEEKFTLGTVEHVVGINSVGDVVNDYVYRLFKDFARENLYIRELTHGEMVIRIKKLVECIEKIRTDYRNRCAHREGIDYITAKECIDYTIETYKKLKEMLEYMKD